jgi:ElaB/YqjD/DUF883 family membrane-anchored ribosome-binding protein
MTASDTSMQTDPGNAIEQQRHEIDATRADLGRTMERIEDRVSPTRIKERQTERLRGRFERAKSAVMGDDHGSDGPGAKDRIIDVTEDARDAVQHAPERLEDATRGNPLAAGLIAFGVGALVGTLLPTTEPERTLAGELEEKAQPVLDELREAGQEVAGELQEHAQHSMESVKDTARDAAETTRDDAQGAAQHVQQAAKSEAQDAQRD